MANNNFQSLPDVEPELLRGTGKSKLPTGSSAPLPDVDFKQPGAYASSLNNSNAPARNIDKDSFGWKVAEYVSKNPKLNRAVKNTADIISPTGSAIAGGVQGGINNIGSVINAPLEAINAIAGTDYNANNYLPNLEKTIPDTPYDKAFFSGGKLGGELYGGKKIYDVLGGLSKASAVTPITSRIAQGAGAGYLTGGAEGENPYENLPSNRLISAGIGGAAGGIGQLSNKALADRIVGMKKQAENEASNAYEEFLTHAENYQPEGYKVRNLIKTSNFNDYGQKFKSAFPNHYKETIRPLFTKNERLSLDAFADNPTIRNAHLSQSEIAAKIRGIKDDIDSGSITSIAGNKKIEKLSSLRNDIKKGMSNFLGAKDPQLIERYNKLGIDYRKNVVPFKNKFINQYQDSSRYPADLIRNLTKTSGTSSRPFMESVGGDVSGLKTRMAANKIMNNPYIKYGLPYVGIEEFHHLGDRDNGT